MEKSWPVMLVGNAGSGKSVLMGDKLESLNTDEYLVQAVPFNFYTTSAMLQGGFGAGWAWGAGWGWGCRMGPGVQGGTGPGAELQGKVEEQGALTAQPGHTNHMPAPHSHISCCPFSSRDSPATSSRLPPLTTGLYAQSKGDRVAARTLAPLLPGRPHRELP